MTTVQTASAQNFCPALCIINLAVSWIVLLRCSGFNKLTPWIRVLRLNSLFFKIIRKFLRCVLTTVIWSKNLDLLLCHICSHWNKIAWPAFIIDKGHKVTAFSETVLLHWSANIDHCVLFQEFHQLELLVLLETILISTCCVHSLHISSIPLPIRRPFQVLISDLVTDVNYFSLWCHKSSTCSFDATLRSWNFFL